MASFSERPNPYTSPEHGGYGSPFGEAAPGRSSSKLPVFCLVMCIVDLVFSVLRMPLVGMGILGLMAAGSVPLIAQTGAFEVGTGVVIVLFGILANIALLYKQRWGLMLAWVKVVAGLGSVAVGWWQLSLMLGQFPEGSPQRVGAIIGGGFVGVLRIGLLGLYAAALVTFARWSAQRSTETMASMELR